MTELFFDFMVPIDREENLLQNIKNLNFSAWKGKSYWRKTDIILYISDIDESFSPITFFLYNLKFCFLAFL